MTTALLVIPPHSIRATLIQHSPRDVDGGFPRASDPAFRPQQILPSEGRGRACLFSGQESHPEDLPSLAGILPAVGSSPPPQAACFLESFPLQIVSFLMGSRDQLPRGFALAVSSAATWNEPGPFPGRGPCSFLRAAVRPHPLSPSSHQCLGELSDARSSSGVPKAFLGAGARPHHAVRSVRLQGGLSCPGPQS